MRDPEEGLTLGGMITTGASRDSVPSAFEPVLSAAAAALGAEVARMPASSRPDWELHLYGSVATGQAVIGASDVDLVTIGIPREIAANVGNHLTGRFAEVCRGVEIGAAQLGDYRGDSDEQYGNRVFLHHYCVSLTGESRVREERPFAGDARAARGFNGDIGRSRRRWLEAAHDLPDGARESSVVGDPDARAAELLGRRIARKTLMAVAGLVSVHDGGWTTDRMSSALRWAELRPEWGANLHDLVAWSGDLPGRADGATGPQVRGILQPDGLVADVVDDFATTIGLWS